MALLKYQVTVIAKQDAPYNVLPNTAIAIRKVSDDTLVQVYSDEAGLIPIPQPGATTDSRGVFEFYTGSEPVVKAEWTDGVNTYSETFSGNSIQALSGLTDPSDLAQRHRISTTVAEIATGAFKVGDKLNVSDRGDAPFDVVSGGASNGTGVIDAGGGNTAEIQTFFNTNAVSVEWFGAKPTNTAEQNDVAIQAFFDYMIANKVSGNGTSGTYLVNQVTYGSADGLGGSSVNQLFDGRGMILDGQDTANRPAFIASGKNLNFKRLKVQGLDTSHEVLHLGFIWDTYFEKLQVNGKTRLSSGPENFGTYWNSFNLCRFDQELIFDVTEFAVNHNQFFGGKIKGLTLTAWNPTQFKQAYNNVLTSVDINGAVNWDTTGGADGGSPLILSQCNYEGDFTCTGQVKRVGGASLPKNSLLPFWDGDVRNDYYSDYQFSNRFKGYFPRGADNLQANGDGSSVPENVQPTAGTVTSVADSDAIVGESVLRWQADSATSSPQLSFRLPDEYLRLAGEIGFYTFGFWIKPTSGYSGVQFQTTTLGASAGGVNVPVTTGEWNYVTFTVYADVADTSSRVFIQGGSAGTAKDMLIDAITLHIGDASYPYCPSTNDKPISESFTSTLTLGTDLDLFEFTPDDGERGEMTITADYVRTSTGDSGYLRATVGYSRASGAAPKFGSINLAETDGAAGALTGLSVTRVGTLVTVSLASVAAAGSTPPVNIKVETNGKAITQL